MTSSVNVRVIPESTFLRQDLLWQHTMRLLRLVPEMHNTYGSWLLSSCSHVPI